MNSSKIFLFNSKERIGYEIDFSKEQKYLLKNNFPSVKIVALENLQNKNGIINLEVIGNRKN